MDNAGLYEQLKNVLGAVAGMYSCIMKVDLLQADMMLFLQKIILLTS